MLVEISYDPDLSRIGMVVDLPDDEARVKIHEGRARKVDNAESTPVPGGAPEAVPGPGAAPQPSENEGEVKGPDPAEHPEPARRPDASGATDEVIVQLDKGTTGGPDQAEPDQAEPDQAEHDKPAHKRRARAS